MSGSSPDDLAITFRSITRRWREAQGTAADEVVADPHRELSAALHTAGTVLGVAADPESIADAIQHRPAAEWTDQLLDQLRGIALQVGALLRRAATLADDA